MKRELEQVSVLSHFHAMQAPLAPPITITQRLGCDFRRFDSREVSDQPKAIISRLMRTYGVTKQELATALRVNHGTFLNWLQADREPSAAAWQLLWLVEQLAKEHGPVIFTLLALRQMPRPTAAPPPAAKQGEMERKRLESSENADPEQAQDCGAGI